MDIDILFGMIQQVQTHVGTMNHELGSVMSDVAMIKWFMGINIVAWIGLMVTVIGKKIFKNNNKK